VTDIIGKRTKSGNTRKDFMHFLILLKERGTLLKDEDDESTEHLEDFADFSQLFIPIKTTYFNFDPI